MSLVCCPDEAPRKKPSLDELLRIEKAALEIERRKVENKLSFYNPYPKQEEFHDLGIRLKQRLLMAGNQCGKSYCGAAETAIHLTGQYPENWLGRRWDRPVKAWAAGVTSETTRDTVQALLLGDMSELLAYGPGRGLLPKDCVDPTKMFTARGVGGLYDMIAVKHFTNGVFDGWSELKLKSYERGREKWQGATLDFIWFDEEPDEEIYTEGQARVAATGGMTFMTFTPLKGRKGVVLKFMDSPSAGQGYTTMTVDDALHMSAEKKKDAWDRYPAYEREARLKGIPFLGGGKVFTTLEENIVIEPFAPPKTWRYIWGVDFGIEHPFAAVLLGHDTDTDTLYVMHCVRMADALPLQHTAAMKPALGGRGGKVPMAWPQDGWQRKEFEGALVPAAAIYKKHDMAVLHSHATFVDGTNSTEAGILDMQERFASGRFKVFSNQSQWLEEYREYHREEGKIYKKRDDLMSATRVGVMAKRFARSILWAPNSQDGRGTRDTGMAKGLDDDPWG